MTSATPRVKLCAIAKNEGAYLPDWVFHHLHFGFDAIEVWVNATTDPSRRILDRIEARHPQVTHRKVDRLLQRCIAAGEHFQERAYAKLARKAKREGFTHAAFLDLDEYWMPRDGRSRVHSFIPEDPTVNVISFPWCLDVPDVATKPFARPVRRRQRVQMDPHVKSVIHLNGSIRAVRAHTARTRGGRRLLVRESFPLEDRKAQRSGAFVTWAYLRSHWHALPEAFVLHAKSRSQAEYLATLTQGMQQNQETGRFKLNRSGYLPTDAPPLTFAPPLAARAAYAARRRAFHTRVSVGRLVRAAEAQKLAAGSELLDLAATDPAVLEEVRHALRGISDPRLDGPP